MKKEKQGRKSNETYSEIGERIKKVLSLNFKDNTLDVDIYNALFGNDELLESSKRTKISDLRAGRGINLNILMLISEKFGVSLDWLVYGNGEKVNAVQATYKALTAISEFARVDISVQPMTKEKNDGYFYTPYKMNIEITPKIYKKYNEDYEYTPPEYDPCEWYYYMDIENYKLARFLYNWYGIYKAPISYDNKRNEYDNLLHRVYNFHVTSSCLAGTSKKRICHFAFPKLCNIPSMDGTNEEIISL